METLELDVEIDGKSTQNDFYFSYMTIDTNDEDDFWQPHAPEETTLENIDFKEDISVEFYETIPLPTLQELSAFVIGIELWRRVINSKNANILTFRYRIGDFLSEEYKNVEEILQHLPLPGLIRELVRSRLEPIKEEITAWTSVHERVIPKRLKISDLMYCVWSSEGKIDQRKTALNVLSNPRMDIFDRFRIMSGYCLEDEIKKLSPDAIPEHFTRRIKFINSPLQYYWLCYMNNNFDKFPIRNGHSIEAFMISSYFVDTWPAAEYFWSRLNNNEQISAALVLLSRYFAFQRLQRQLFSKMNQFQKYYVLSKVPVHVIMNFYYEELYQLAFSTVVRFGNMITFDDFEDLILMLLPHIIYYDDRPEAMHYLVKIWNYFSDDYKSRAVQSIAEQVFNDYCVALETSKLINTDFLVAFLSSGSAEFRRRFILEKGEVFVFTCDLSGVDKVVQLCFPDTNGMVLFEDFLLRSDSVKYDCLLMLDESHGDPKRLAEFLHHFISNSVDKMEFICEIVQWTDDEFPSHGDPMKLWNNAIEFIDSCIESSPSSQIIKYKKRIVWSFVNILAQCKYDYKDFHKFIPTISQVLRDNLLKYKEVALKRFVRQCRWAQFDKLKVHQFLLWCLDYDYVEMKRFVKSLSIDRIFWYAWENVKADWFLEVERSFQDVSEKLVPIDKMLLWYFGKSERVKEFKLGKIFGFRDRRPGMFVKRNALNEVFARNVLPWFFEGDRVEICRFKELFENHSVAEFINIE